MQRLTLAQQIAQFEDTAPADFDPEDAYGAGKEDTGANNEDDVDMDDNDPAAGREHYVEVGPSELRKMRDNIGDPKYDGVKTSRSQLIADKSEEEPHHEERDSSPDSVSSGFDNHSPPESEAEDDFHRRAPSALQNGDTTTHIQSIRPREDLADMFQTDKSFTSSLRDTRSADKLKGKIISQQLEIWDSLVDARIRLQKSVTATNKLPLPVNIGPYVSSPTGRAAAQIFLREAVQLSEELFDLRHILLAQKGLSLSPRKKRRISPDEENPDYEALVGEWTDEMVALDAAAHADTLSTLQKWSSKVQAVAPSVLLPPSRSSFKGSTHIKGAAELVDEALRDQDKAVSRTWGKNDRVTRIDGISQSETAGEGDEEAFDDRDFYHNMLRDVIESKGRKDGMNATDLYANSNKQRKKRHVDTKASKGRKIRYEPHEKLQHFMVPVPVRGAWHEEQVDELFASLLGKGFEDETHDGTLLTKQEGLALQGFRVFG